MKVRGLINWCIVLLWVVATHHCVFEQLIGKFHNQPFSQTANSSPDSSFPSECPSHPAGDPSSHGEGKSCGTIIQTNTPSQLHDSTLAFVPINNALVNVLINGPSSYDFHSVNLALSNEFSLTDLLQRAHSLSIAPNAPPVTLA